MLKKLLKLSGFSLLLFVGVSQATILSTTVVRGPNDTSWQNIDKVSYDAGADGIISLGEEVTFTVTMSKNNWGSHDFDALKFWIQDASTNAYVKTGEEKWDFNGYTDVTKEWTDDPLYGDKFFKDKDWTGGTKDFSFTYTFNETGNYNIIQSVMCSRDLSNLVDPIGKGDDIPTVEDWAAWDPATVVHQGLTRMGTVKVPEPSTVSFLACGLMSLIGAAFFRRRMN